MKIGVLADDFTGAGDVGLMFEKAGLPVEMTISDKPQSLRVPGVKTKVWVIDTESRGLSPKQAALRVKEAMSALKRWKATRFYKKIDSTLRGNLTAELAEFIDALPKSQNRIYFVPAFPRAGRTVKNGYLFVDGRPLARTVFARDPRYSVRSSSIS